jgi:hypothetical protein
MAAAAASPTGGTRDEPLGLAAVAAASAFVGALALAASALLGPSRYLSAADVPAGSYQGNAPAFLDNFEDGSDIDGGLSASAGACIGPGAFTGARDSVDGDDGLIDGSGVTGSSGFSGAGAAGVRFTYSGNDLPTARGLVWTNGAGTISFSAFQLVSQAFSGIPDGSFGGTTAEDHSSV